MIQITQLSKVYSTEKVLDIEHLEIPSGQTFGIVGNNGAGKTTFFSLLLDLIKPSSGHIINNGIQVNTSENWKSFTTAFFDESFLIGYLTAKEFFYFIGDLRGISKLEIDTFLENFGEFFNGEILGKRKYLRDLSKGNQKKVGIVSSFIGNPKVVILDEPFANLDPSTQIKLKKIIQNINQNKDTTILISSHDLTHITEVCERIVILEKGSIVKDLMKSKETLEELEGYFSRKI